MSDRLKAVHAVEIYDGRDRIGEVQELSNGQYRALDNYGGKIGLFDKADIARSAVGIRNGRAA